MQNYSQITPLFGGGLTWMQDDWTSSDDRVRGGKSQSYLTINGDEALFEGNLDTRTLGGAGFASQRTTGEDRRWDLASSDGFEIVCNAEKSDEKVYAFVLKDELLPKSPNGREQSTVSWEFNFKITDMVTDKTDSHLKSLRVPWSGFAATYRGRPKPDAEPLNKTNIKRISIMMRSFFDSQSGDFRLAIKSIAAYTEHGDTKDGLEVDSIDSLSKDLSDKRDDDDGKSSWKRWLCGVL